jgi:hypothetical protein
VPHGLLLSARIGAAATPNGSISIASDSVKAFTTALFARYTPITGRALTVTVEVPLTTTPAVRRRI